MGLLPPCPCYRSSSLCNDHSDPHPSTMNLHLHSSHFSSISSSASSLSSQSSLPSVPSLTSQPPRSPPPPMSSAAAAHHFCVATFKGQSYVSSLALVSKSLLSAYSDGEVRSWSRHPLDDNRQTRIHDCRINDNIVAEAGSAVKCIVAVGDMLITAHQDHKIRVWKVDDRRGRERDRSADHHQIYRFEAALPTLGDRLTRVFSAKNYVEVRRHKKCSWVHHVDAVSALALSHDGALLYSISWDRSLKVWRTSDFKCLESINKAHDDAINAVVVSPRPDGLVYTGSADTKIKVWARLQRRPEGDAHSLVAALEKHRSAVNALALSGDGRVLYSGACDRSVLVWEREGNGGGMADGAAHMVVVGALRGHGDAILCLAVVCDLVISGSADKTVRVWRRDRGPRSYSCLAVLVGHTRPVKCVAATATATTTSGDGDESSRRSYMVYSGGLDCSVKVWQVWVPPS
ncbi:hypothetical protein SAY87_024948 [Trapa incisa]|uniref:Transducin/WD40 repeat-like superfamily protein n=1 Tax=Trapa incisa TaxID=236973 RepID=A0AAN7GF55_9MYRT|nr:hypothetical protein SAY87_024948 [Trapa incisa]